MTRLNGNDFLACSLQLFEQKGLLRVQLNNHLPEHRPALQNCFHRTKGKGAPGGSDDQYGSNTDVAGSRLSADKAILKAVLESTMCSHAESSVPSRCDTTSNYWLGFNSYLTLNLWFGSVAKSL